MHPTVARLEESRPKERLRLKRICTLRFGFVERCEVWPDLLRCAQVGRRFYRAESEAPLDRVCLLAEDGPRRCRSRLVVATFA